VYIVEEVGLKSVRVEGKNQKFNIFEVLKVSPFSQDINNSLRQKQLDIDKADKRIRERDGIEPDRRQSKVIGYTCSLSLMIVVVLKLTAEVIVLINRLLILPMF
jgi:hypothetical protein